MYNEYIAALYDYPRDVLDNIVDGIYLAYNTTETKSFVCVLNNYMIKADTYVNEETHNKYAYRIVISSITIKENYIAEGSISKTIVANSIDKLISNFNTMIKEESQVNKNAYKIFNPIMLCLKEVSFRLKDDIIKIEYNTIRLKYNDLRKEYIKIKEEMDKILNENQNAFSPWYVERINDIIKGGIK